MTVIGRSKMLTRLLLASLPVVLAGTFGLQLAHADIYMWVDASGTINVSNLPPPDGVSVTKVTHESAPPTPPRDEAARAAANEAEVQALEERVGQLENELERARRQPAPPLVYSAVPAPPIAPYATDLAPPVVPYSFDFAPTAGCDATVIDCGPGWAPGFYPAAVFVLRPVDVRHHPRHGGQRFAAHQPMRAFDRWRKG